MNFAAAATTNGAGPGGACSSGIVDDSIDDTKPQLLNLSGLTTVWPQQQQQHLLGQDLLSSVIDGSSAASVFSIANASSAAAAAAVGGGGGGAAAMSNTSPQSSCSNGGNNNSNSFNGSGGADGGDAEGVWSPDIDQAFHEALQIYPPCGRRKIILSDEGKMYGRNELIARYIKIRCGKTRSRKQVSSHIQVLARKKQREHHARMKAPHHQHQDGQQQQQTSSDFVGMSQQHHHHHQLQQLALPPSTSGSISPNSAAAGAALCHGGGAGADPSSVESNQSTTNAFHHTNNNIAIVNHSNSNNNGNGIAGGGGLLSPARSGGTSTCVDGAAGGGAGCTSSPLSPSAASSCLTTATFAAAASATTMPTAHLLLGMAPTSISNTNNNVIPNRESASSIVDASAMHQKMLEAASAISNSVMSSMPNPAPPPPASWPYSLNAQHLLGGIQMAASRPPHDLYSSLLGGLQPTAMLKTESQNVVGRMISVPNGTAASTAATAPLPPCRSSAASAFSIDNFTIASSRLILCGFTAYIEQNLCGSNGGMAMDAEENRVEIVKIPKISDAPLERIGLDCVQSKYPELLQDLFKKGPSDAFFLVKCWANMHFNFDDQQNSLFAVDSFYESSEKFDIIVSTKVCSFGNEVVEKVEIYSPIDEEEEAKCSGVWHFRLEKSPMCDYMVQFIEKLKKLQEPSMMNCVLENLTVLQIVTDKQTNATLMVIAFMFEVQEDSNIRENGEGGGGDDEIFTNIYRITE